MEGTVQAALTGMSSRAEVLVAGVQTFTCREVTPEGQEVTQAGKGGRLLKDM